MRMNVKQMYNKKKLNEEEKRSLIEQNFNFPILKQTFANENKRLL